MLLQEERPSFIDIEDLNRGGESQEDIHHCLVAHHIQAVVGLDNDQARSFLYGLACQRISPAWIVTFFAGMVFARTILYRCSGSPTTIEGTARISRDASC